MDLVDFYHTKDVVIINVYNSYLEGFPIEHIWDRFRGEYSLETIENIVDCYNYLYL